MLGALPAAMSRPSNQPLPPSRVRALPVPPLPRPPQEHALRKIYGMIDTAWAETSEVVAQIEALSEDGALPPTTRQLAAAVASKVSGRAGGRAAARAG
jgi:hypothetical protein